MFLLSVCGYIVHLTMAILSSLYSINETLESKVCVLNAQCSHMRRCSDVRIHVRRRWFGAHITFLLFDILYQSLSHSPCTVHRYEPRMKQMSFTQNMSMYVEACYEKCNTIFVQKYELPSPLKHAIALKWSLSSCLCAMK